MDALRGYRNDEWRLWSRSRTGHTLSGQSACRHRDRPPDARRSSVISWPGRPPRPGQVMPSRSPSRSSSHSPVLSTGPNGPTSPRSQAWHRPSLDAHTLAEVLIFLEHIPDRGWADEHAAALAGHLGAIPMFHLDPDAPGSGLSPLHLAPAAGSRWRALVTDTQIGAHLDHKERSRQPDGRWPITWQPPSEASALPWRGIVATARQPADVGPIQPRRDRDRRPPR